MPLKLTRFLVRVYNSNDDCFYTVAVDAANSGVAEQLVTDAAGDDREDLQHIATFTLTECLEELRTVFGDPADYTQRPRRPRGVLDDWSAADCRRYLDSKSIDHTDLPNTDDDGISDSEGFNRMEALRDRCRRHGAPQKA